MDYKECYMLDYKVWQNGLQSALGIAKCGRVDYKVRQGLQSVVGLQSELVQQYQRKKNIEQWTYPEIMTS